MTAMIRKAQRDVMRQLETRKKRVVTDKTVTYTQGATGNLDAGTAPRKKRVHQPRDTTVPADLAGDVGLSTIPAARVLGVSPKTLENWRWRGVGPVYRKCGKSTTYSVADLKAYLSESRVVPQA